MAEMASIEAFEEAGVRGAIDQAPLGSFKHEKRNHGFLDRPCIVEVVAFKLMVEKELERWPEMNVRERHWYELGEAAELVSMEGLRALFCDLGIPKVDAFT